MPDLLKDLQTKGSEINQIVVVWPTRQNEFAGELKICGEFLKAAEKLLGRSDASTVKEVQASIVAVNGKSLNAQEAWDLYGEVQRAIANLTQVSKDLNWK
ncbi:hypothetical protein WK90_32830 [Burkholderia cepacia]|nr:hypothetical protein WK83_32660 [Burkholderia cepacia]KVV67402.1 hypothetical protein WK85_24340 [Burkholderia cepacia]KVV70673.1 hypothetical protein WK84_13560 [Burkholderia cepacia]KVV77080.1 hypothetical protein WK87_34600 [Burkholderia cepacia]KVV85194.1 hypothetical protein WK86_11605 [Burkholderia cepacia]